MKTRILGKILARNREYIISFILIGAITTLVWHKLLEQTFLGEGYYYFDPQQGFINAQGRILNIMGNLDVFARFIFDILPATLGDNITGYFAFQLAVMIILNWVFFLTVYFFTKNFWISLTAAVLFLGSYTGSFEMLGTGNYQRFVQRVPNLIVGLIAFIYLAKYSETKKLRYYFLSILLFCLSVLMSHFTTFLLPLFVAYPVIRAFLEKTMIKPVVTSFLIAISFVVTNFYLIDKGFHTPDVSLERLSAQYNCDITPNRCVATGAQDNLINLIEQMLLQLANLTLPPFLVEKVAAIANPYTGALILFIIPFVALLVLGTIFIRNQKSNIVALYLASLFAIFAVLTLNLYVGKVDASHNISGYKYYFLPAHYLNQKEIVTFVKGDRYYLIPSLFLATNTSLLLWSIFQKKKDKELNSSYPAHKIVVIILLTGYLFYNTNVIWKAFEQLRPISDEAKTYINYAKSISHNFNNNTTLVVPSYFIWPSPFVRLFYGYPDMQFTALKPGWENTIPEEKRGDVIVIDYDYTSNKFIDLTEVYNLKMGRGK